MNKLLRNLLLAAGVLVAGQAAAQVTFYQNDGFNGQAFTADRTIGNFERWGFNDRASSVSVRGGNWEICTDAHFRGRCTVLSPGDYPSLRSLGLNDRISSAREVSNYGRYEDRRYSYDRDEPYHYRDRDRHYHRDWDR